MYEVELNPIDSKTDLSKVKIEKMNWDVNINGIDYTVCRIPGYPHGEGGTFGLNDYYCYPTNEIPNNSNLLQWWSREAVRWGFIVQSEIHKKYKWGDKSMEHNFSITVTRNDQAFYTINCRDMSYGIAKAQTFIAEVVEGVVNVQERDFDKQLIGRKIRYKGKPAIITEYFMGQHSIWIEADNPEHKFHFEDYEKDKYKYWTDWVDGMKVECLSSKIDWFPKGV